MAVTPDTFRTSLPEFTDATAYPDAGITFWLTWAGIMLNVQRWGRALDLGTLMFVAHHLVLERQAQAAAANGGVPGTNIGVINNKSVDKVTVGYDTTAAIDPKDGHWNLSTYGTRFISMVKMFGAGPIQVGIGSAPPFSGPAWPGPFNGGYPNW